MLYSIGEAPIDQPTNGKGTFVYIYINQLYNVTISRYF